MRPRQAAYPFLAVGIALMAIGASGNRTFVYVGIAFIVIALVTLLRGRR